MPIFLYITIIFILSAALTMFLRYVSNKYECFIDKPNERSSHSKNIPRCGGLSIASITLVSALFLLEVKNPQIIGYFIGAVMVVILGIADDFLRLNTRNKFLATAVVSVIPLFFGLRFYYSDILLNNQIALGVVTFLWIFGMTNAFNFMDGIDGLIAGTSIIFCSFMTVFAILYGNNQIFLLSLVMMSSCAGFLLFNMSPASIFLGDAGSMFLGYTFAVFAVVIAQQSGGQNMFYAFCSVFAVIIYDAMFTFFRRLFTNKEITSAHREHLYQRLVIMGFSHRQVSTLYYMFAVLLGLCALLFNYFNDFKRILIVVLAFLVMLMYTLRVSGLEEERNQS